MDTQLIIPISITMGVIMYAFTMNRYAMPKLNQLPLKEVLIILILPHAIRYIGLSFLVQGTTAVAMDPRFANTAAYGDLLAAVLALVAVMALASNWRSAKALAWIFNIVGSADFLGVLAIATCVNKPGDWGATIYLPMAIVPFLMVTHILVFKFLLKRV